MSLVCCFLHITSSAYLFFFFFNDTATTEIYTLSLHDALPICRSRTEMRTHRGTPSGWGGAAHCRRFPRSSDRKSTRLNSSHLVISYAVFCLKKKKLNTFTYRFHTNFPYRSIHIWTRD